MAGASWGSAATGEDGGRGQDPARIRPPLMAPCSPHSSQPLPSAPEELPRPGLPQVSGEPGVGGGLRGAGKMCLGGCLG